MELLQALAAEELEDGGLSQTTRKTFGSTVYVAGEQDDLLQRPLKKARRTTIAMGGDDDEASGGEDGDYENEDLQAGLIIIDNGASLASSAKSHRTAASSSSTPTIFKGGSVVLGEGGAIGAANPPPQPCFDPATPAAATQLPTSPAGSAPSPTTPSPFLAHHYPPPIYHHPPAPQPPPSSMATVPRLIPVATAATPSATLAVPHQGRAPSQLLYMLGPSTSPNGFMGGLPVLTPRGKRLLPASPSSSPSPTTTTTTTTSPTSVSLLPSIPMHLLRPSNPQVAAASAASTSPSSSPSPLLLLPAGRGPEAEKGGTKRGRQSPSSSSPMAKRLATTEKAAKSPRKAGKPNGPALAPEVRPVVAPAPPLSSTSSVASSPTLPTAPLVMDESLLALCAQISVALQDQVVYWGQSKNKCDVTARVFVPTKLQPLLSKRATCHLKPSPGSGSGPGSDITTGETELAGGPESGEETSATNGSATKKSSINNSALLVLKHQTETRDEYEVLFKQCIKDRRLSNLTLLELVITVVIGGHAVTRVAPMVTYTHSKAITRASCRLIWYPAHERDAIGVEDMLGKLDEYHRHHLEHGMRPSAKRYYQTKLPQKNHISYEEFYNTLGEWFVLAIKLAKKKKQYLWQQGEKSFIPMLINPAREEPTILREVGDFVIHIGEEMKSKKGSNSLPQILYPLQITYIAADGQVDCMGVESKLDKLNGFIHEKRCLAHYVALEASGPDGHWVRIEKERFAFNAAQHRQWESTGGESCVVLRGKGECASYAHAS